MAYSFDQIFAADPANPSNVAQNASITIFAPGDGTMTPLTITDPDGQPLANPIPVNANGFGSAFAHETLDRVAWQGGGFTGFFTSYEGMKAEAVAARAAAETAASTAGADAAAVADAAVATVISEAESAAASAASASTAANNSATSAAAAAALVGAPADTAIAAAVNGNGAAKAALDAIFARPRANSVILFGTSLEHQNQGGTDTLNPVAPDIPVNGRGWYHWANAFCGGHMNLVRNAGIPGNKYSDMLARIDADVLAYASDWVFIGGPVNDISSGTGRPAVDIIADATAILDKLKGRRVVMLTAAPSTSYDTLSKRQALASVNAWICDLPKSRPNVIVADAWRVLVNPATGAPATGMAIDNIVHYSQSAAARIGKVVADAVQPWLASSPPKVSYASDPKSAIANPNFLTNGLGWATTASVTASYVADENTFGNKAVLTFAGNTGTGDLGLTYTQLFTANLFAVGDVIQMTARVKWSNFVPVAVSSRVHPVVRFRQFDNNNVFLTDSQGIGLYDSQSNAMVPNGFPTSGEVVVRTHKVTVQNPAAGMKSIQLLIGFVGMASGTVEISDLNVAKV